MGVRRSIRWFILLSLLLEAYLESAAAGICSELISPQGYTCEEHQVTTADGYILGVQRIPHGIQGNTSQHALPVFLQHGVLAGGEHWVVNSPKESLAFILADSGFDVWIGSLRGTQWSQGHVSLTPDNTSYWDWTWDEHLSYDLPAMLKLVRDTTKSPVKYIGHSQGTTIFLAGLTQSSVTQYVDKAALLAPIAYLNQMTSIMGNSLARIFLDKVFLDFGIQELRISNEPGKTLIDLYCAETLANCSDLLTALTVVRTGYFGKYDYGLAGNMEHYGQATPPAYSLSNIPASFSLMLVYGGTDALATLADVHHLIADLPNPYVLKYQPNYGHLDYSLGTSANRDVYQLVIQYLKGN